MTYLNEYSFHNLGREIYYYAFKIKKQNTANITIQLTIDTNLNDQIHINYQLKIIIFLILCKTVIT